MRYYTLPTTTSVKEASLLLGVTVRTVHHFIHDGKIRSAKIGRSRRIHTKPLIEQYGLDHLDALRMLNVA